MSICTDVILRCPALAGLVRSHWNPIWLNYKWNPIISIRSEDECAASSRNARQSRDADQRMHIRSIRSESDTSPEGGLKIHHPWPPQRETWRENENGWEKQASTYLNDTFVFGMTRALKCHVRNLSSLSDNEHFHDLRHLPTGENGCVH